MKSYKELFNKHTNFVEIRISHLLKNNEQYTLFYCGLYDHRLGNWILHFQYGCSDSYSTYSFSNFNSR